MTSVGSNNAAGLPTFEPTTVRYTGNIAVLNVWGGKLSDQFFISSTAANTTTNVDAGPTENPMKPNQVFVGVFGTDSTVVGSGDGSVQQLAGPLTITDHKGPTALVIDSSDPGGQRENSYQVYADHVVFSQGPTIQFPREALDSTLVGVTSLTVYGSRLENNVQVNSVNPATQVVIWGPVQDVISGPAVGLVTHNFYPAPKTPPGTVPHVPQVSAV